MQDVGQLVSRYTSGAPLALASDDSEDSLVRKVTSKSCLSCSAFFVFGTKKAKDQQVLMTYFFFTL